MLQDLWSTYWATTNFIPLAFVGAWTARNFAKAGIFLGVLQFSSPPPTPRLFQPYHKIQERTFTLSDPSFNPKLSLSTHVPFGKLCDHRFMSGPINLTPFTSLNYVPFYNKCTRRSKSGGGSPLLRRCCCTVCSPRTSGTCSRILCSSTPTASPCRATRAPRCSSLHLWCSSFAPAGPSLPTSTLRGSAVAASVRMVVVDFLLEETLPFLPVHNTLQTLDARFVRTAILYSHCSRDILLTIPHCAATLCKHSSREILYKCLYFPKTVTLPRHGSRDNTHNGSESNSSNGKRRGLVTCLHNASSIA